jgi:hypothetical protein
MSECMICALPGPYHEWSCSQAYYLPGDAGPGPCPCDCHRKKASTASAPKAPPNKTGEATDYRKGEEE